MGGLLGGGGAKGMLASPSQIIGGGGRSGPSLPTPMLRCRLRIIYIGYTQLYFQREKEEKNCVWV